MSNPVTLHKLVFGMRSDPVLTSGMDISSARHYLSVPDLHCLREARFARARSADVDVHVFEGLIL